MMTLELMDNVGLIQDRINQLLSEVTDAGASPVPALNVWQSDNKLTVTGELPGIDVKDLEIAVQDDVLMLRGRFNRESETDAEQWVRRERSAGEFSRRLKLPFKIQDDQVAARYSRGVLRIELPRADADKPKRIEIKVD